MNESKGQKIYRLLMVIIITALITGILTTILVYQKLTGTMNISNIVASGNNTGLELTLSKIRATLEKKYIGEIDDKKLLEGAIKGYVAGLGDEYAQYYTKEEMSVEMDETNGKYVGIGIYMTVNSLEGTITVTEPMEGSPAEEVGLKTGDMIIAVNDEEVTTDNVSNMSNKIKGEEGTKVKLKIKRGEETFEVEVERKRIVVSHTKADIKENSIGYIQISDFEGGTAVEFQKRYEELKKKNIKSLIIDLRGNGGGVVDEALSILNMICDQNSTLLITVDKSGKEEQTKSKQTPIIDVPVIVLTNGYSASASEILAGALKDNNKAKLVGTKTYGKGVIQTLMQLSDGSGLKMTTEEYYTPSHNKINKVGIDPDYEVKLPSGITELTDKNDTQLQKAIELLK